MKLLIFTGKNRFSNNVDVSFSCLSFLINLKNDDDIHICVTDKNINLIRFLKKKKIKTITYNNLNKFIKNIDKFEYDWLINLWGHKVFSLNFLNKFKNNLNLHPSYLPYGKGKDPIIWSIINNFQAGTTIHKMTEELDSGAIYVRKKIKKNNFITGKELYISTLKETKDIFCHNWIKIRNKVIRPTIKNTFSKINKRKDLKNLSLIDLDNKKNDIILKFIKQVLSFDFSPNYNLAIKYNNKIYKVKVKIND